MDVLYSRLLKEDFSQLPALVQHFHLRAGRCWRGRSAVVWGTSPMLQFLLRLANLPRAGSDIPLEVMVELRGQTEIWRRSFAGRSLRSDQKLSRRGLHEIAGPWGLDLACTVQDGGLVLRSRATRFLGLPLPTCVGLAVEGKEWENGGSFHFDVSIGFRLGRRIFPLLHYLGWLLPDSGGIQDAHR